MSGFPLGVGDSVHLGVVPERMPKADVTELAPKKSAAEPSGTALPGRRVCHGPRCPRWPSFRRARYFARRSTLVLNSPFLW